MRGSVTGSSMYRVSKYRKPEWWSDGPAGKDEVAMSGGGPVGLAICADSAPFV